VKSEIGVGFSTYSIKMIDAPSRANQFAIGLVSIRVLRFVFNGCVLNWVTDFAGVDRFNFFFQPEHPQKHLRLTRCDNARLFIAKSSEQRHPSQLQNSECMLALLFAECAPSAAPRKLQVRFFFSSRIQFCFDQQLALCGKVFSLFRTNKRCKRTDALSARLPIAWTQAVFFDVDINKPGDTNYFFQLVPLRKRTSVDFYLAFCHSQTTNGI
jgi:hypothetical protein